MNLSLQIGNLEIGKLVYLPKPQIYGKLHSIYFKNINDTLSARTKNTKFCRIQLDEQRVLIDVDSSEIQTNNCGVYREDLKLEAAINNRIPKYWFNDLVMISISDRSLEANIIGLRYRDLDNGFFEYCIHLGSNSYTGYLWIPEDEISLPSVGKLMYLTKSGELVEDKERKDLAEIPF